MKKDGRPTKQNLLRWYNWNLDIKRSKENTFWIVWNKNRLFRKRLYRIYK